MKTRYVIGAALAAAGVTFLLGFATTPSHPAAASAEAASSSSAVPASAIAPQRSARPAGRQALPTVRRFDPPPIPSDDPGVAALVNAPDEPPADVVAARWEAVDRRLDALFGDELPGANRAVIKTALVAWIRDHGRVVRAYYQGNIDQAELTEHIHQNLLAYARTVEPSLTRDQYRTFMDLEPGEDPFLVLGLPGTVAGAPMPPSSGAGTNQPGALP